MLKVSLVEVIRYAVPVEINLQAQLRKFDLIVKFNFRMFARQLIAKQIKLLLYS